MKVQNFAAGAVFVGAVTAGMFGAAPAFADAGISIAGGGNQIGIGDQTQGSGAYAQASKNSLSLAISTGRDPKGAIATANGNDNTAVAIDGVTIVSGEHNHGFSAFSPAPGGTYVNGVSNNAVTVAGLSDVGATDPTAHDNFVVNAGGVVLSKAPQGNNPGAVSVSVCGNVISGQAAHIDVSPGACGS